MSDLTEQARRDWTPKRYEPYSQTIGVMKYSREGHYVCFRDYDQLRAEVDRLKSDAAIDITELQLRIQRHQREAEECQADLQAARKAMEIARDYINGCPAAYVAGVFLHAESESALAALNAELEKSK